PVTVRHSGVAGKDIVYVNLENEIQVSVHLFKDISSTFQITVFGENGWKLIDIRNSYAMFRDNLIEFIRSVEEGSSRLAFKKTINIIDTLISAQDSLQQNGKLIKLV
ncbi:MAG: gfo/Idh/MocA family oxidoreductase, partial [Saprospiraceae bacterium]|nr:gfo/Idh/MocA family oxidoreductase [Saprospiraceae bacterium]